MRCLACLAAVVPTWAWAGVVFDIPAPGYQLPEILSGTNCPASGLARAEGTQLREVEIWLKQGAKQIKAASWSHVNGPGVVPQRGFAVRFASTEFENDDEVKIYMRAKDSNDVWTTSQEVGRNVQNEGLLYEITQFALQSGIIAADIALEAAKHDTSEYHYADGWTKALFLSKLQTMGTAIHLGSHGQTDGDIQADDGLWMSTSEFLAKRSAAVENGVPPMNVGLLDDCNVGLSQTPEAFLYPSNPPPVDRAIVSFNVEVSAELSMWYANAFWSALQDAQTVDVAVQKLISEYNSSQNHGKPEVKLKSSDVRTAGDPLTKLIGVYWPAGPTLSSRFNPVRLEAMFP